MMEIPQILLTPLYKKILSTGIGLALILVALALARRHISARVENPDIRYKSRKVLNIAGYLAVVVFLAFAFSDQMSKLGVALGVAGAGIAFALQEVIASLAGWVAISFGNFYSIGDRIQLGGIKGDVIDIGMLRTTLMELGQWINADRYNGRIVRVANSFVFKEPVFNYSADFPFLWDEIVFPVRYGSDWKYAKQTLEKVAEEIVGDYAKRSVESWKSVVKKYRVENLDVRPQVTMKADENWFSFTIRYVVDYRHRSATRDTLYTRIIEEVDASGGRINIASSAVEILTMPKMRMTVEKPQ